MLFAFTDASPLPLSDGEGKGNRRPFAHHPRTYPKSKNALWGPGTFGAPFLRMTAREALQAPGREKCPMRGDV